jgi:hypothetical protein
MVDNVLNPDSDTEATPEGYPETIAGMIQAIVDSGGGGGVGALSSQVQGAGAAGAAAVGNPVGVGGVVNAGSPDGLADGFRQDWWMGPRGSGAVFLTDQSGAPYGDAANGLRVQTSASEYETVAASQTDQIMGATGAVGDLLDSVLIVPTSTTTGAVSIKDGNGSTIVIYAGGTTTLIPFSVPWGAKAVNATTPGWKITTGAGVTAVAFGNFT